MYNSFMKINIKDIPPEGRRLEFNLETSLLNDRVQGAKKDQKTGNVLGPECSFEGTSNAEVTLLLEGSTVQVKGLASGQYRTLCSRCAEDVSKSLSIPIELILKPTSGRARKGEEEEDLAIGYYHDDEIDCAAFSEEFLVLNLPYVTLCSDACRGLCQQCGTNLNRGTCDCKKSEVRDNPFSVLKGLVH